MRASHAQSVFGSLLVLLAALLSAWMLDQGLGGADEGWLLSSAERVANGELYYRDLDAYPFPGSSYLLALAFQLFGVQLLVARVLEAALFCGMVACLYGTAVQLLTPPRALLYGLGLLGLKLLAWPTFSVYSHYDLAHTGACAGLLALLHCDFERPGLRLALAGVGVGVALVAKQNVGLYVGAAVVAFLAFAPAPVLGVRALPHVRLRCVAVFSAGAAAVALPFVAWFAAHGLLVPMLDSALLRPLAQYLPTSGVSFAVPLRWWELGRLEGLAAFPYFPVTWWVMLERGLLPVSDPSFYWRAGEVFVRVLYTAFPIGLAVAFVGSARALRSREPAQRSLLLVCVVGLALAASAFPRADFAHVISVYPLVALLLLVAWERGVARAHPRTLVGEGAIVCVLLAAVGWLALLRSEQLSEPLELERARVRSYRHDAYVGSVVPYLIEELGADGRLFVHGSDATWYFLTGRHYDWPFPQLYPGHIGGDGGRALVEKLRSDPPALIVQGLQRLPGLPPLASYAPELVRYVRRHYELDPEPFRRRPPPEGGTPQARHFAVLRPVAR